ncbi:unnamed protein product [Rhizophagus irregularis]|nr:unnamed protein product [Rhizophagus irregularis]
MANTLDDIRKKTQEFSGLESELKESVAGVQDVLNNRTERISLKDKKFKCHNSASEESIAELFESISDIDPTLKIEAHCRAHAYSFQVCVTTFYLDTQI